MKKLVALLSMAVFASAVNASDLRTEANKDTNIIKHKKGWAPVLTLKGDRGTGLYIDQGNKQATGIRMDSGNATVTMSPSYAAAGVNNGKLREQGLNNAETAAVVFQVSGSKLDGDSGNFVVLDAKNKQVLFLDSDSNIISTIGSVSVE
ncbi:hypothetical protein [Alteromonas sp. P256]|uniref:hypothetical protein n=1 Tax=Alteromonas sp. P256 TaxID=3117399 RepID=UPI002FDFC1E7